MIWAANTYSLDDMLAARMDSPWHCTAILVHFDQLCERVKLNLLWNIKPERLAWLHANPKLQFVEGAKMEFIVWD